MRKHKTIGISAMLVLIVGFGIGEAMAENIDPDNVGAQYAYGENVGWINFRPAFGPGVTVTDMALTGFAWGENIGWINLNPSIGGSSNKGNPFQQEPLPGVFPDSDIFGVPDLGFGKLGVANDGAGNLSGFAWAENVGWIDFAPTEGGVHINPATGKFSGKAWGENIGWINFNTPEDGPVFYKVLKTAWRGLPVSPEGDLDGDGDIDRDDLNILLAARGDSATGPDDPRDLDGDGRISALDVRRLILLCTRGRGCPTE